MNAVFSNQTLQYVLWALALLEIILSLYILALNAWHSSNRHVSLLFLVFSINNLAMGFTLTATEVTQIVWPTQLLAITSPIVQMMAALTALVILRPHWLQGRWRWIRWPIYALLVLPVLLTALDVGLGTHLWYALPDAATYAGGYPALSGYTGGTLAPFIMVVYFYLMGLLPLFLGALVLFDRRVSTPTRRLGGWLFGVQVFALILQMGLQAVLSAEVRSVLLSISLAVVYAYAAFQQMISERRSQRGSLVVRLTLVILVIGIPLLLAMGLFVYEQTREQVEQNASDQLQMTNRALGANVSTWLDLNIESLQQLVILPDIIEMEGERQKPILEAMATAHPHMYLVSTTDLGGVNVARSDTADPKNYGDRPWFLGPRNGAALTFQSLIGRTSGEPALVVSMPIWDSTSLIVGVGMFASDLTDMAQEVLASQVGETGVAYVVDVDNRVIAHPDPAFSAELYDFSDYAPVAALRAGEQGLVQFADEDGVEWWAYVEEIDYGWGVVVQQQEDDLLGAADHLRAISRWASVAGALLMGGLTLLAVRQALMPVGTLTEMATAMADGDLTRTAHVESEDEMGLLARAFNRMAGQLADQISGLEQRVAERTRDLERRAQYLVASAQVARDATLMLEPQELMDRVVDLVTEHFGFYHAGIFLVDENREWAVLRSASSEGGRRMLARGHRLRVGEVGIVGHVTGLGEPRVALDVGEDAVYFDNPDMQETRSEMALPLRVRGEIIGALDVQSREAEAFTGEDVEVLQTMADQVAMALNNAQLFQQVQAGLEAERRAFGEITQEAWGRMLRERPDLGYRCDERGVSVLDGQSSLTVDGLPELALPIEVRGQVIGTLKAHKSENGDVWGPEDVVLMRTLVDQLEQALESARLYQDTQQRAAREQMVGQMTARFTRSLDLDAVLQAAVRELAQLPDVAEVTVHVGSSDTTAPEQDEE